MFLVTLFEPLKDKYVVSMLFTLYIAMYVGQAILEILFDTLIWFY